MSFILFIIAWILILLIVVALSLVIIYGRKIDDCRTSKILYCYAGENGWRCDGPEGPGTITLQDQLEFVNFACNPIDCVSLGDPLPSTTGSTQFTVLPFAEAFNCGTDIGFECNPEIDLSSFNLLNFPGNPLIPTGNIITGPDLMKWFCDSNYVLSDQKAAALNNFTAAHPEAYLCQSVTFKGQTVT